ncbi:hypothetical protein [Glycomyces xiaoerkulensis]|uniref:hypothetical protein n=1 Tax=Glycomyces xiaoerkulensis TaxID=2038139 RepID=UPI000C263EFE|nr:hypothetical protein [Glycomyces xiaoerkulensis]
MLKRITAAAALVVLAACDPADATLDGRVVPPDELSLEQATAALFLSPQTGSATDGAGTGYVLLAGADGRWRAVEHAMMDQGSVVWTGDGLFYSDTEFDYRLDRDLTKVASPKTNLQDGFYVLDDGTIVSILNEGFTDSPSAGYRSQVVVTGDGSADSHRVEGWHASNARCGDEIFGIGPQSGPYFDGTRDDPAMVSTADPTLQPQMLTRLYPLEEGAETLVGHRAAFDFSENQRDLPCTDRTVTFLSSYADREGDRSAAVVRWDVDTGEHTERELTGDFDADDIALARYDSESVADGRLQWLHRDGHLMSTDVGTGVTERVFDTGARSVGTESSVATFTQDEVVTATVTGGSGPVVVAGFDRGTGAESRRLELDGVAGELGTGMVLRSIAVAPGG